jgi:ribosomal protein S18 acetylase RimI-like enzyme
MSVLAGLRRATAADVDAVTALQRAAYARNREILGVEPLPLLADYTEVVSRYEVWLAEGEHGLDGALILEARPDDLLIWSVATVPRAQGRGLGRRRLAAAEARAAALGRRVMRLYTGEKMTANIAWYGRHGYAVERIEELPDRRAVHMVKTLVD